MHGIPADGQRVTSSEQFDESDGITGISSGGDATSGFGGSLTTGDVVDTAVDLADPRTVPRMAARTARNISSRDATDPVRLATDPTAQWELVGGAADDAGASVSSSVDNATGAVGDAIDTAAGGVLEGLDVVKWIVFGLLAVAGLLVASVIAENLGVSASA